MTCPLEKENKCPVLTKTPTSDQDWPRSKIIGTRFHDGKNIRLELKDYYAKKQAAYQLINGNVIMEEQDNSRSISAV